MRLVWEISEGDVERVKAFLRRQADDALVRNRVEKNVLGARAVPTPERFWQETVACLLTTQQRSGPTSSVSRLISTEPFPLDYSTCCSSPDLTALVLATLGAAGGIRRSNKIASEMAHNLAWLRAAGG